MAMPIGMTSEAQDEETSISHLSWLMQQFNTQKN
jgi:hypothetical protein